MFRARAFLVLAWALCASVAWADNKPSPFYALPADGTWVEYEWKRTPADKKEEQGGKPCSRNCVDPISRLILDLFERATLLMRVRAPPETWTTSLSSDSLSPDW